MKILALDLSISGTGWAHSNGTSGVQSFKPRRGDSPGMRWLEFRSWLLRVLDLAETELIAYEQAHHRGGGATHAAHALIGVVEQVAAERKIELTNRHTSSIKSHALPNDGGFELKKVGSKTKKRNKRNKARMMRAAENRWPDVDIIDDNHADALWLLDLVQTELGGCH